MRSPSSATPIRGRCAAPCVVDRTKDMIITGGFNVYPREIEDVIAEHPAVAQVAVIGIPDAKWGEAVTAVIVLRAGPSREAAAALAAEIQEAVRERKGPVHTPKRVIIAEVLPLTGLGKLDKKVLRAQYAAAADTPGDPR